MIFKIIGIIVLTYIGSFFVCTCIVGIGNALMGKNYNSEHDLVKIWLIQVFAFALLLIRLLMDRGVI